MCAAAFPRCLTKCSTCDLSPVTVCVCVCNLCVYGLSCKQEADESLNFEEQILEAAKSIAAATSALVKAASAAQRELVAQGKVRPTACDNTYQSIL